MELLYKKGKGNGKRSRFTKTVLELCVDQKIKIVCPYIDTKYLKKLIESSESWAMVVDSKNWKRWCEKQDQLEAYKKLNSKYAKKIHHVKDVHAKVIITKTNIYLGSANFTKKGLEVQDELSVVIYDEKKVKEANKWFKELVKKANEPSLRISTNDKKAS